MALNMGLEQFRAMHMIYRERMQISNNKTDECCDHLLSGCQFFSSGTQCPSAVSFQSPRVSLRCFLFRKDIPGYYFYVQLFTKIFDTGIMPLFHFWKATFYFHKSFSCLKTYKMILSCIAFSIYIHVIKKTHYWRKVMNLRNGFCTSKLSFFFFVLGELLNCLISSFSGKIFHLILLYFDEMENFYFYFLVRGNGD